MSNLKRLKLQLSMYKDIHVEKLPQYLINFSSMLLQPFLKKILSKLAFFGNSIAVLLMIFYNHMKFENNSL